MYVETKRKYLYYRVNDKVYKVPTYGRIFKIIDFGRSIYHYKNILLYSDAFDKKEDAATQYNFGPFRDEEKPEILPNKSFDLSRLACSLYDYFDDYEKKNAKDKDLALLIKKWCTDDSGKNILYKSSGEERYPEFILKRYKTEKKRQIRYRRYVWSQKEKWGNKDYKLANAKSVARFWQMQTRNTIAILPW